MKTFVYYWTNKDDREGACSPSGIGVEYTGVSEIRTKKKYKRKDGTSRIYDMESF